MRKFSLLLAAVGMIFSACESGVEDVYGGDGGDLGSRGAQVEQSDAAADKASSDIAPNTIYYTTSDGKALSPNSAAADVFGATLLSNEYANGQGVMTFDNPVTLVGDRAFEKCSSLTGIVIPEGVTSIGEDAFFDCTALASVALPDGLVEIKRGAFRYSEALQSVIIPNGVTTIGDYAFCFCSSLVSATLPEGVKIIGGNAFRACTSLKNITLPLSVTSIGDSAFMGCTSLTDMTVTRVQLVEIDVLHIGEEAFSGCSSLISVTIPARVTEVGWAAFMGCTSLKTVYCKVVTPPANGDEMFENNAEGRKIYVPAASVEAYKAANGWQKYAADIVGYNF